MFKKTAPETFPGIVSINVLGEDAPGLIDVRFKNIKRSNYNALLDKVRSSELSEADFLLMIVDSWNIEHPDSMVDEPLSRTAIDALLEDYWDAGKAFITAFVEAKTEGRRKN